MTCYNLNNGRIIRQIFGDEPTRQLQIPRFIDDYRIRQRVLESRYVVAM